MKRSEHRILTTHVGSLIRPQELRDLAPASQEPKDPAQYATALAKATAEVVEKQAEIGIVLLNEVGHEFGQTGRRTSSRRCAALQTTR
jgi:5-methyltetrahydropteroyltriglutamate--homocysteine methyltransferase